MIDLPHNLASDDYVGSLDKDREQTLINRSAIEFAKNASEEYEMPPEAIQLVGKTNAAATPKGVNFNTEYAKHLDKTSESYKMLDSQRNERPDWNRLLPKWSMDTGNCNATTCALHPVTSRWRL